MSWPTASGATGDGTDGVTVVTPMTLSPLLLAAASSSSSDVLRSVEAQLKNLEVKPGFYSSLLTLLQHEEGISDVTRLQAVLYLKNGIDRYWRKTAPNAITQQEKEDIKSRILQIYVQRSYPVALQLAVMVGKISRFDVPKDWPQLFPVLESGIKCGSTADTGDAAQRQQLMLQEHRSLLLLYHVIKVMASKRLGHDRRLFHEMTEQLLPFLFPLWKSHHTHLTTNLRNGSNEDISAALEVTILVFKNLRRLIIQGLRRPAHSEDRSECAAFLVTILQDAKIVLAMRKERLELQTLFDKYVILHLKLFTDLLENHPYSFLVVMKDCLQFICWLCFTSEGSSLLFQRAAIFSLNILKQVMLCPEYKPSKHDNSSGVGCPAKDASSQKRSFFDDSTVTEICNQLLQNYLPLLHEDLVLWDTDPEQYACEEVGDAWKYNYRPCCESMFLTLFHEFREVLAPFLIDQLRRCDVTTNSNDLTAILRKDAVYNAVGLVAFELFDEVDFDGWLVTGIKRELSVKETNYRIVRRRAIWLIGRWSGVKLSPENRPLIYELLLPALQASQEPDLVVRLTAAKSLKIVIDDFEFCAEEVRPHLQVIFQSLFQLLQEVEECDTKLTVLNVLSYLIERVSVGIRDICQGLVHYLPHLWEASSDHEMLRCSILTTLIVIVQSLGTSSHSITDFVFSVVKVSTDFEDKQSVYLLEDGLELWLTALHNSKHLSPQWMQMVTLIPRLLEMGDYLRNMIYIVQAYILLSPHDFLRECGPAIATNLDDQFSDLQDEGILLVLRLVDLVTKVGPPETPAIFKNLIMRSYRAVYEGTDYPMLMSLHLSIISRIITCYPNTCNEFLNHLSSEMQKRPDDIQARLLDIWLDKMILVTQSDRRKLLAMGLATVIFSGSPVVQQRIHGILQNMAEALNDVMKPEENNYVDSLLLNPTSTGHDDEADYYTEHDTRKRDISLNDIVHKVSLNDFIQNKIRGWGQCIGETTYTDIMVNLDAETRDTLKEYITL